MLDKLQASPNEASIALIGRLMRALVGACAEHPGALDEGDVRAVLDDAEAHRKRLMTLRGVLRPTFGDPDADFGIVNVESKEAWIVKR